MQEVHFCSGSVFVTGDVIAMSLLRYVQAVSDTRQSDVVTVPSLSRSGGSATVTLMLNGVSQISADSFDHAGPELEDDGFVQLLDGLTYDLLTPDVWAGEPMEPAA